MDYRHVLPAGTELDGKYLIERVIGAGGFGITYAAHDIGLNITVALKEYYPADFGTRDNTMSVRPKNDQDRDLFERLRQSFVREARTLAQFKHPSIVRVLSVFESHGTAYMVMEFEEGSSLKAWLQGLGRLPTQEELDGIVRPLLDALDVLHKASFLHRDIAPDNIILRRDMSPVLLDFGAARRVMAESNSQLTGIIKQGYSPQEQHASDGKLQGPWTDIYALGATLYHATTGSPPLEAMARMLEDTMVPAVQAGADRYRYGFLAGIDAALSVRPKERPQSIPELKEMLFGDGRAVESWQRARTQVLPGARSEAATQAAIRSTPVGAQAADVARSAPMTAPHVPQSGSGHSKLVGAGIVGALVMTGLFGAYQLGSRRTAPVPDTIAVNTKDPGKKDVTTGPTSGGLLANPPPPERKTQEPAKKVDPLEKQADAIIKEAQERARRAEEERKKGEQRGQQKSEPLRPTETDRDRIERDRVEQAKRSDADADYQEALKFANGTGGVTRDYARARPLFEQSAARGNRDAMNWIGWLYFNGRGVPLDYARAREWYEKAAAAGHPTALNQMGWLFQNGLGVPRDLARSVEWYQRAATAGNAVGMYNLGTAYQHGRGVALDNVKAREWYERAAELGDNSAMSQLGWLYQHGLGLTVDYVKAREWYEKAANAGSASGMNQLGWLYQNGLGMPRDYVKAREWYERAATNGNGSSMNQLGWLFQNGLGTGKDLAKARDWYEKAANAGNATGMYNLASLYENGQGVSRDFVRAREWYERAAAGGDSAAMNQMGWLLQNGQGVAQDYVKAREWYEKGAAAGNATAMSQLGWLYQNGLGVPQDYARAKEWYERSAATGGGAAMNQLGWLYQNGLGVPKDLAKAREWYEKSAGANKDSGIWNLALALDNGNGGPVDYVRAAQMLLRGVRIQHEQPIKELAGTMANWNRNTRIELKRELQKSGHYQGSIDDRWDDAVKRGVEAFRRSAQNSG